MSVGAGIGNLLSDTDFIDNDHLGAWDTKAGSVNTTNKCNGYNSYYKYSSNSYDNVLSQILFSNDIRRIQPDTVYTLSFYAKGVGTLITYVHPSCIDTKKVIVDGTEKEYWAADGSCEWSLNYSNYVKHTFTFKTTSSFNSDTKYLLFRLKSSSQYVYISQPRLDVGYSARDYTEGLTRAGINIGNGTVNLYGDKVIFSDREGGNTDKIWIDPDDGTLNAVDGNFSGKITATSGTVGGMKIDENKITGTKDNSMVTIEPGTVQIANPANTQQVITLNAARSEFYNSDIDIYGDVFVGHKLTAGGLHLGTSYIDGGSLQSEIAGLDSSRCNIVFCIACR